MKVTSKILLLILGIFASLTLAIDTERFSHCVLTYQTGKFEGLNKVRTHPKLLYIILSIPSNPCLKSTGNT